jgi:hypothetical protein
MGVTQTSILAFEEARNNLGQHPADGYYKLMDLFQKTNE